MSHGLPAERVERWAMRLAALGLGGPAVILLEASRLFGGFPADCAAGFAPLLPPRGQHVLEDVAHFLGDAEAQQLFVDVLARRQG